MDDTQKPTADVAAAQEQATKPQPAPQTPDTAVTKPDVSTPKTEAPAAKPTSVEPAAEKPVVEAEKPEVETPPAVEPAVEEGDPQDLAVPAEDKKIPEETPKVENAATQETPPAADPVPVVPAPPPAADPVVAPPPVAQTPAPVVPPVVDPIDPAPAPAVETVAVTKPDADDVNITEFKALLAEFVQENAKLSANSKDFARSAAIANQLTQKLIKMPTRPMLDTFAAFFEEHINDCCARENYMKGSTTLPTSNEQQVGILYNLFYAITKKLKTAINSGFVTTKLKATQFADYYNRRMAAL